MAELSQRICAKAHNPLNLVVEIGEMQIPLEVAQSFFARGTRQPRSADAAAAPLSAETRRCLCCATELARSGRYADAEQLAVEVVGRGYALPTALDLLARIYAQQGRYLEAESCWQKALSLSPGNQQYRWGLDTILRERGYPPSLRFLRVVLLTGLVILVLLSGYLAGRTWIAAWARSKTH